MAPLASAAKGASQKRRQKRGSDFSEVYRRNAWGGAPGEFFSGAGSRGTQSALYIDTIEDASCAANGIRTEVDIELRRLRDRAGDRASRASTTPGSTSFQHPDDADILILSTSATRRESRWGLPTAAPISIADYPLSRGAGALHHPQPRDPGARCRNDSRQPGAAYEKLPDETKERHRSAHLPSALRQSRQCR